MSGIPPLTLLCSMDPDACARRSLAVGRLRFEAGHEVGGTFSCRYYKDKAGCKQGPCVFDTLKIMWDFNEVPTLLMNAYCYPRCKLRLLEFKDSDEPSFRV